MVKHRLLLPLVLIGLAAISCSSSREPEISPVAIDFFSGGSAFSEFRTAYDLRVRDLTDLCMRENGFPDWVIQVGLDSHSPSNLIEPEKQRYFGVVDGLEAVLNAPVEHPSETQLDPVELDALDIALNGENGCSLFAVSEARVEFRIDEMERIETVAAELNEEYGLKSSYLERVDEWSRCMALQGIAIANPNDIHDRVMHVWLQEQEGTTAQRSADLERIIFEANQQCPDPSRTEQPTEVTTRLIEQNQEFANFLTESLEPTS